MKQIGIGCRILRVDKKKVSEELKKVEAVLSKIPTSDITQTNYLIYAAATVVTKNLGVKTATKENKNGRWWKRRLEGQLQQLRRDLIRLQQLKEGKLSKARHREDLQKKYRLGEKGVKETQSQIYQYFQKCFSTIQLCRKLGAKHCKLFCLLLGFDKGTK